MALGSAGCAGFAKIAGPIRPVTLILNPILESTQRYHFPEIGFYPARIVNIHVLRQSFPDYLYCIHPALGSYTGC